MRKHSNLPDHFVLSYEDKQYFAAILKKQIAALDTDSTALQAACNSLLLLDPSSPCSVHIVIINFVFEIAKKLSEHTDQINNYKDVIENKTETYSKPSKVYAVGYDILNCFFPEILPVEKCHTIEARYVRTYPAKNSNIPVATTPEEILAIRDENHKTFIMNNATYRFI